MIGNLNKLLSIANKIDTKYIIIKTLTALLTSANALGTHCSGFKITEYKYILFSSHMECLPKYLRK